MKERKSSAGFAPGGRYVAGLLTAILAVLFWRSFLPEYVHFSNDGPLGQQNVAWSRMPACITGMWCDVSYIGFNEGTISLSISALLHFITSPVGFAKFYPAVALWLLGLASWTFFRQLKLSPLAAVLGALAAMLNSTFFSSACWGVASQEIAAAMDFFALALIVGYDASTPALVGWTRLALAGLCVGMNVMEAADIGALFSILVAIFVFVHAWVEGSGAVLTKVFRGFGRVAVVAGFAGFIALQTVLSLVGNSIQGVAGTAQDSETKAQHWDWATQWSLPKTETFGLLVPGLFGYKMDTPKDMMPALQDAYRNGVYWGGVGRDPSLDRYFDAGSQGTPPSGFMRFTGGGNYCGMLVLLVAGWAIAQSMRRKLSPFSSSQKRMIQFWAVVLLFCLLFAWGRFAPFYALLYRLPYFSTIRNPAKFLIFFSWATVIIFGYGVHALNGCYLDAAARKAAGFQDQIKIWWSKAGEFDRRWTFVSLGLMAACVAGWMLYGAKQADLIQYLQKVGFSDPDPTHENSAAAIAAFSLGQVGWFLVLFALALGLLLVIISGYFNGSRAKAGTMLLGGFMLLDMGRANLPWVVHWDYKQKYEVGSLNPILETLRDKPYEHRVVGLPFEPQQQLRGYDYLFGGSGLYRIEWVQHQFPYYDIQSLDVVQMPRPPEDMKAYKEALAPRPDPSTYPLIAREWLLTNTRYLLGAAGFLDVLNQELDPAQHRFRIVQRFDLDLKPGVTRLSQLEQLAAVPNPDGDLALFEFTGALPRARIYSDWQVNTNDSANLKTLGDLGFDPAKTVLVSTPEPGLPVAGTNDNSGSVECQDYQSKHIVLSARTTTPSVLLLNDKFDPSWRVTVDGKPAQLLRCNFIMRGVFLPAAGQHTVDFRFTQPLGRLYITLVATLVGLGLGIFLFYCRRRGSTPVT
jgi:hypothetical protein